MTYLDVLAEHGLDPLETSGGRELTICCPLCQSNNRKLYVNAKTGQWICFVCEERGNPYRLLREVLEIEHFQAMRLLDKIQKQESGPRPLYVPDRKVEDVRQEVETPREMHLLTDPSHPGQGVFWRYLAQREVSPGDVLRHRMGFALHGRYAYRILIPVYSEGTMWTFAARTILPDVEPRVLYAEGSHPSRALFNIDNVTTPDVFLVEGVFDALRLRSNAVASLGTNLSAHQRDLLRRKGVKTIIILWDGDPPGRAGAARVAEQLHAARFHVRLALLPNGKDPASATWQELHTAIFQADDVSYPYLSTRLSADRLDAQIPK
jgi:DNA primase